MGAIRKGKAFFSVQASLPNDLASVVKILTFSCYIEWSLNLFIHDTH